MSIIGHIKRFWRFHGLLIGALSISAFTLGCAVQEPAYYEGTWVVTEAHQGSASMNDVAAQSEFLGRSVIYSPTLARLDQDVCESPVYSERALAPSALEQNYDVSYASLGFSNDQIRLVELSCVNDDVSIGSRLLYQENTLAYTHVDGTFLKLEKAVFDH